MNFFLQSIFLIILSNVSFAHHGCHDPMGMEDGSIKDYQISASSHFPGLPPAEARINSTSSWSALHLDKNQYFQVDFLEPQEIAAIITKGRHNAAQWVTAYQVVYSDDGIDWKTAKDERGALGEFNGNSDQKSSVVNALPSVITARFIRIIPVKWYAWISMRVEFLGCYHNIKCKEPMGMISGAISNNQITASSSYDSGLDNSHARLNDPHSWSAKVNDDSQYLLIDFLEIRLLCGVVTKGRGNLPQWVKRFNVVASTDSMSWSAVTNIHGSTLFEGNHDQNSAVINLFDRTVSARMIKIIPVEWHSWISMRLEVLGCYQPHQDCEDPMGMESKFIRNYQLSASSVFSDDLSLEKARINSGSSWSSLKLDSNQYITVDFIELRYISGIITRGRENLHQWVTEYRVAFSIDGENWSPVYNAAGQQGFTGNADKNTPVTNLFNEVKLGRFFKIMPTKWFGWISLRFELLGCFQNYECMEPLNINYSSAVVSTGQEFHTAALDARLVIDKADIELNSNIAWSAKELTPNQFVQVGFHKPVYVRAIVTKGKPKSSKWVSAFQFTYSKDGQNWETSYPSLGHSNINRMEFKANTDANNPVINLLQEIEEAHYYRIIPTKWSEWISLRLGLLGCS